MAAEQEGEGEDAEKFYGVIKSYNERRGFGFVACEETARRYGRDVYLSKEEGAALIKEPVVGLPPASGSSGEHEEGKPPVKEGDFVQFQVQKSTEGFPQAVQVRRIRRLRGVVIRPPGAGPDGADGAVVVKGDGALAASKADDAAAVAAAKPKEPDAGLSAFIGTEIRVRQAECGQLRLAVDDEVAFCCCKADALDKGKQVLEAQLLELMSTSRSGSSLLGCFALELPRTLEPTPADKAEDGAAPAPEPPKLPPVHLDGHALADRVVLAGLPRDLAAPELMRLFLKLGASEAKVTHPSGDPADKENPFDGFASVVFASSVDVARFLVRAAHTINGAAGSTVLARLGPVRRRPRGTAGAGLLPAMPQPTASLVEEGSLIARWSQVSLAVGYSVELRPCVEDSVWASVDVAAGSLEDAKDGTLPEGLLGPHCSACRVDSLRLDCKYEARVTYFVACGCFSQASESSQPIYVSSAAAAAAPKEPEPVSPPPPVLSTGAPNGAAPQAQGMPQSAPPTAPAMAPPMAMSCEVLESSLHTAPPPHMPSMMPGMGFPGIYDPYMGMVDLNATLPPPHGHGLPPPPGWRCQHGGLVPPPAAPEVIPLEEGGRTVLVQWPGVIHAVAYAVEFYNDITATVERFSRNVPENLQEPLVELRVTNLQRGSYGACVRCLAPCGCESAPSAWSFMPPPWLPTPPGGGGCWPAQGGGYPQSNFLPPYMQKGAPGGGRPPSPAAAALLSTNPGSPSPPTTDHTLPPQAASAPPTEQSGGGEPLVLD